MNCPYPWKWSFQNELGGGIRWDKACSVCWADKHWRLGRKLNARAVTFYAWPSLQCRSFSAFTQLTHILAVITSLNQRDSNRLEFPWVLLCTACEPLFFE